MSRQMPHCLRSKIWTRSWIVLLAIINQGPLLGQSHEVKVSFAVDGKTKPAPSSLEFRNPEGKIIAVSEIKNRTVVVPPDALREPVTVAVQFQGRRMAFEGIYPSKFNSDWAIAIEGPPFPEHSYLFAGATNKTK